MQEQGDDVIFSVVDLHSITLKQAGVKLKISKICICVNTYFF